MEVFFCSVSPVSCKAESGRRVKRDDIQWRLKDRSFLDDLTKDILMLRNGHILDTSSAEFELAKRVLEVEDDDSKENDVESDIKVSFL